ncbi:helix-turn-helix domain-containing protein [Pseudoalteromonas rhizosphaerae]|uniref:helix-turn-helix domain-containing protein n=1 Tax=Pseudoalteromonas rhizosphaerae TaxID=2518973 RepID=UPI00237F2960|nr:helix-turn-helix domain-containing protein [Pseudoalteromonas rhizosphaerae]
MSEKEYVHSVGVYLSDVRRSKGMTQTECGKAANISRSTISDIEKGFRLPSGKDVVSLCQVLDITPNDIFSCGGLESPVPDKEKSKKEVVENAAMLVRTIFSFYRLSKQSKRLIGDTIFRLAAAERGHDFVSEAADCKKFVEDALNNEGIRELVVDKLNTIRVADNKEPLDIESFDVAITELLDGIFSGNLNPISVLRK